MASSRMGRPLPHRLPHTLTRRFYNRRLGNAQTGPASVSFTYNLIAAAVASEGA